MYSVQCYIMHVCMEYMYLVHMLYVQGRAMVPQKTEGLQRMST